MIGEGGNGENGNGSAETSSVPHVIVSVVDVQAFKVQVQGAFPSLDYAINMLSQALRELEAQWRLARASLYQQQQVDLLQEARLRAELRRGN
jgi:hypothetical protein